MIGLDYVREDKKALTHSLNSLSNRHATHEKEREKSDRKKKKGGNTKTSSSPSTSKTGDIIVINVNTCDVIQREEN